MKDKADNPFAAWLQSRSRNWVSLNQLLKQVRGKRDDDPEQVRQLVKEFRGLATDLSLSRQSLGAGQITRQLEALYSQAHETIYQKSHNLWQDLLTIYRDEVPALVTRKMRFTILATISIFIVTSIAGWLLVHFNPELASLFASERMINMVQSGKLWTDDLLNIVPSSVLSFRIMANNISVSLFAFVLGALYGIGTLYIISLNGFMLGGIFAFTAHHNMAERLFNFVIAHGVVELSIICLAGAAGVQLGEALIRPGHRSRGEAFHQAVTEAGKLMFVVVPFLVGAGLIEGYVSPNDLFTMQARVSIGVLYGILMWLVLSGWIWRWGRRRRTERRQARDGSGPVTADSNS